MERIYHSIRVDCIDIFQFLQGEIEAKKLKHIIRMVTKSLLFIVSLLGVWFIPIKGAFILMLLAVFLDTMTGVLASHIAYKRNGKQEDKVTSNKAFRLVPKLIFYGSLIILGQALLYYVEPDIPWVKIALIGISWIEIRSIDENFEKVFGFSFLKKIEQALMKVKNVQKRTDPE